MRVILHVGTHKTATTYMQRSLKKNRDLLRKHGLHYPSLRLIDKGDSYGHHYLAHQLARNPSELEPPKEFMRLVKDQASEEEVVLISTEAFYRHGLTFGADESDIEQRENYIKLMSETYGSDCEIVMVMRRPDSFLLSVFQESTKKTSYPRSFESYLKRDNLLLQYDEQLRLFSKYFSSVTPLIYEDLISKPHGIVKAFLDAVDINLDITFEELPRTNVGLHTYCVEYKRLLNYCGLSSSQSEKIVSCLAAAQSERKWAFFEQKISYFDTAARISFLAKQENMIKKIQKIYFQDRKTPLFPDIKDDASQKLNGLPAEYFEKIHGYVSSKLNMKLNFET